MAPVDSNVNIKTRTGFNYAAGHNQGAGNHGSGSCGAGGLSAGTRNASAGDGFDENMFPSHSHSLATLAQDGQGKGQDSGASFAPMDQNLAHSYTKNLFGIPEDPDVPPSLNKISLSHSGPLPSIPLYLRAKAVRDYLTKERKLSLTVCERYGVGVAVQQFPSAVTGQWEDNTCVTFPWIEFTATAAGEKSHAIRRIKYRSLDTKGKQRILPKGGAWGFFGWHLVSEAQSSAGTVTASASRAGGNDGSSSSSSSSGSETMSNSSEGERTENAIIITEGEYDALAVAQAISDYRPSCVSQMWVQRTPVVSLPNGCNSLPVELIMKLEKFSKIYLWLDNDSSGIAASANFTRKLGIHRCFLVKPLENCVIQPKDANDIIRYSDPDRVESASVSDESSTSIIGREFTPKKPGRPRKKSSASSSPPGSKTGINDRSATGGVSREQYMRNVELMMEMLHQAQPVRHDRVVSFSDIKHDVLRSLVRGSMTEYEGTLCTSLPTINDITKGFRRGELIVFSGPTGSGKTTLLSQMSVDFASQGIPTLWGSFEIQNVRLAQKMLHQYNSSLLRQNHEDVVISASDLDTPRKKRRPRALTAENFKMVADDFEQLPFQFLNFHGGSSLGDVLDAMDYAVYKHDIQHIILDNLQFMMPGGTGAEAFKGGGSSAVLGKSSFNNNFNTSYSDISRYTAGLDVGTKFSPISKFETQDLAIQAFRKFATINNVNVILVIHPRKEDDNLPLGMCYIVSCSGNLLCFIYSSVCDAMLYHRIIFLCMLVQE